MHFDTLGASPAQSPAEPESTSTLIAAVRLDGITAPYVFDGPIDGETFRAGVEQMLAPTPASGDIVVMNNLASHKARGIREAIEAAWAELLSAKRRATPQPQTAYVGANATEAPCKRNQRAKLDADPESNFAAD